MGAPGAGAIDPVVHPLPRLRICAMLAAAEEVEFGTIQDHVGLSTSGLSKQLSALVGHGYVVQRRGEFDSRRRWLALTPLGRERYREHMAALTALAAPGAGRARAGDSGPAGDPGAAGG